ncbi:MAG: hypothetical protein HFJ28_01245 [Clostridia bacterium]|nr:hypothetical protein [Clostridia bacterium]
MEYIIIIITSIISVIALKFAWNIKLKDIKLLKEIGYSKELNEITNKLPENKRICETILKKLENETVTIKEEKESKTSLYIVLTNSILIANIKDTFTRVQTVAHECLHSVQNRKTLLFNFVFSNLYYIYFLVICVLTIWKLNFYPMLYLFILTILSFIYYAIRSSLEMEAMTKAKFLAKEYIEEEGTLNKQEQTSIIENYEKINQIGIPLTNFKLAWNCYIKIVLYAISVIIFC